MMTNRIAKEEIALLLPNTLGHYFHDDTATIAAPERAGMLARVKGWVSELLALPQRAAVMRELNSLSDHELADIGLSRGDIPSVFGAEMAPANDTRATLGHRAAA